MQRSQTLLLALAQHPDRPAVAVEIAHHEPAGFEDPQPGRIHRAEQHPVGGRGHGRQQP
jgi:hypothetical protein